jgi:hypothetical protein
MVAGLFSIADVLYRTAFRSQESRKGFMAIYNLNGVLNKYGDDYLILDFNHLFISSSIREEIWLLQRKNDSALLDKIIGEAHEHNIYEVRADRDFETYSGGQKAILACLLTLAVIRDQKVRGLKLLLNNILDSISEANRSGLSGKFKQIHATHDLRLFTAENGRIKEIFLSDADP